MSKTINGPGFTAEAALSNRHGRFQATATAAVLGGALRPAASPFYFPNHPIYCLKIRCVPDSVTLQCHWVTLVGTVNPITHKCE